MRITQNFYVYMKGDAAGNIIHINDKIHRECGWDSKIIIDLFSEYDGPNIYPLAVRELNQKSGGESSLTSQFKRFLALSNRSRYIKQYLTAIKNYKPGSRAAIEKADVRIWFNPQQTAASSAMRKHDMIFFLGWTPPSLMDDSLKGYQKKFYQNARIFNDMEPSYIVISDFLKEMLIKEKMSYKKCWTLPLFHTYNLAYQMHEHQKPKLITYSRYSKNKQHPELAKLCSESKLSLIMFGDTTMSRGFRENYLNAKRYESDNIRIMEK